MDTTLRDGEQTPGVNFTADEKLVIAEALLRSGVDAIEVASARISEGEGEALRRVADYARSQGLEDRVEVLGFVDGAKSADWILTHGGRVLNLLAKGSRKHCETQLRVSGKVHCEVIERTGTSGALTEATITWRDSERPERLFTTRGVSPDQLEAAMEATVRMLNYVELRRQPII